MRRVRYLYAWSVEYVIKKYHCHQATAQAELPIPCLRVHIDRCDADATYVEHVDGYVRAALAKLHLVALIQQSPGGNRIPRAAPIV